MYIVGIKKPNKTKWIEVIMEFKEINTNKKADMKMSQIKQ